MSTSCGTTEADALMTRKLKYDRSNACVRCKDELITDEAAPRPRGKVIIRHAVYCRLCFVELSTKRLRKVVGPLIDGDSDRSKGKKKTKKDKKGVNGEERTKGNLAIAWSGGMASTVLLDAVYRTYFESSAASSSSTSAQGGTSHPRYTIPWEETYILHVVSSPEDAEARKAYLESTYPNVFTFVSIIPTASTPPGLSSTSKAQVMHTQIQHLLTTHAKSLGCHALLLGSTLTGLSMDLISGIAQGAGSHITSISHSSSSLFETTPQTMCPLREWGLKETAFWYHYHSLSIVNPTVPPAVQGKSSIQELTKAFILGLEKDYPSTVSAISRTCGKLVPKEVVKERQVQCLFCQRPTSYDVSGRWKSRISITSLDDTSSPAIPEPDADLDEMARSLCYTCHTALSPHTSSSSQLMPAISAVTPMTMIAPVGGGDG